jgi:hypothetical protein
MTDYHYHFYCYGECFARENSKPKKMYDYLRTFIEPTLPDIMPNLEFMRQMGEEERKRCGSAEEMYKMSGLYCLYRGDTLLAVADIVSNMIARIITIPAHRHQGHATRLITEIKTQMIENGVPKVYCPVAPHITSLFEKAGWVKVKDEVNKDGTTGYCPAELKAGWVMGDVDYEHAKWLLHLLFLQRHLFKPKDERANGMMNALRRLMEQRIATNS